MVLWILSAVLQDLYLCYCVDAAIIFLFVFLFWTCIQIFRKNLLCLALFTKSIHCDFRHRPFMYSSAKFCLQFLKIFGSTAVVLLSSVFLIPVITNYLQVNDLWCLLDPYMCGIHYKPHYYCEPCTKGSMPHTLLFQKPILWLKRQKNLEDMLLIHTSMV